MSRLSTIVAFGLALGIASAAGSAAAGDEMMLKKAHEGTGVVSTGQISVEKATGPNAHTVAEIHAKGAALDKTNVTVRGKVVKVSRGIMGRNWIHLRDGSGDQAKGTHNLVVTSADAPQVGDVVTASGTLAKDKDFGAGYLYAVILENATIGK